MAWILSTLLKYSFYDASTSALSKDKGELNYILVAIDEVDPLDSKAVCKTVRLKEKLHKRCFVEGLRNLFREFAQHCGNSFSRE